MNDFVDNKKMVGRNCQEYKRMFDLNSVATVQICIELLYFLIRLRH